MEGCHAREIIEEAFAHRVTPEIINTNAASSLPQSSPTPRWSMAASYPWTEEAPGGATCLSSVWRRVKFERVYIKAYSSVIDARTNIANYFV
ncbi:hypothetical protein [Rhodoferax sp.]|uniref:hypothetical protein n=1 Tax=Rhodoferax sp. TaxID=50421 RepID=UPI003BB4B3E7